MIHYVQMKCMNSIHMSTWSIMINVSNKTPVCIICLVCKQVIRLKPMCLTFGCQSAGEWRMVEIRCLNSIHMSL